MHRFVTIACLAAGMSWAAPAIAQMGPNLDLTWNTIDCGGGMTSSGALALYGSIGQPDAGVMSAGTLELRGGFLAGGGGPPPCYPDCNASGGLTVADFTCFQNKFIAGDPYADCNNSGALTVADFTCFQNKFIAGCP